MSGFGNTCIVGIVEKTEPSRKREGLDKNNSPSSLSEEYMHEKMPRNDRLIAATQSQSPECESINVAIIQTKEGDFKIGLTKDPHGLKSGKYIKWIKPDEGPYFIREGYIKGKLSDVLRLFRGTKKKEE